MSSDSSSVQLDNSTLAYLRDASVSTTVSILYIIISLINFPTNGLALWLLLFRTSPKTSSIVFMINLTLSDLAMGCVLPFQIVYLLRGYNWSFGFRMCGVTTVLFYANMYCSILTMTAISIDRYLGIVWPMRFKGRGRRKAWAVIGCVVMWAIVLAVLYPLQRTDLTFHVKDLNITTCFDVLKKDMLPSVLQWALFMFSWYGTLFFVPFVITVFCYVCIIYSLSKSQRSARKGRALRLAFSVFFVFIVCFAPNNVILLTHSVRKLFYKESLYTAYKLSLSLSCLNSCLDPFIYYFACKEFRHKLRGMLGFETFSLREDPTSVRQRRTLNSASSPSDC